MKTDAGRLNAQLMFGALILVVLASVGGLFTTIWHQVYPKSPTPQSPLQLLVVWLLFNLACVGVVAWHKNDK